MFPSVCVCACFHSFICLCIYLIIVDIVCMCIYVCISVCVCFCVYVFVIYIYMCVCVWIIYTCACISLYVRISAYLRIPHAERMCKFCGTNFRISPTARLPLLSWRRRDNLQTSINPLKVPRFFPHEIPMFGCFNRPFTIIIGPNCHKSILLVGRKSSQIIINHHRSWINHHNSSQIIINHQ